MKTNEELCQDKEVHDVFTKIDYDMSGSIDVSELHNVFIDNGILMTKNEISGFFNLCQTQSKGYLNFEEFKELYKNPKAD